MSTFGGKFAEIQNISVDCFDENNYNSSVYFLSHCHSDHMRGLSNNVFQTNLVERENVFLYASEVSVEILKRTFPTVTSKLKALSVNGSAHLIPLSKNSEFISVTLIPAGHCPGSVMFLFESKDRTILYTGDYRICPSDYDKFNAFKDQNGKIKRIHTLYLDTTFFHDNYPQFPKRGDSLNELKKIMQDWIQQSENHIIQLKTSSWYGAEYLFKEISNSMSMPIHVSSKAYDFYTCIPEMDGVVTLQPDTKLHSSCGGTHLHSVCEQRRYYIKIIHFTAMYWHKDKLKNGSFEILDDGYVRVCYSFHASLEEGKELIRFLKPDKVVPCVTLSKKEDHLRMLELIDKTVKEYTAEKDIRKTECVKLFNRCVYRNDANTNENNFNPTEKINDNLLDLLESPPSKRKNLCNS